MVNPNVALACASAGAVLVTVAFFLGIAFMTSDQFATAGLQCNPEVLTNADAQTVAEGFCVDNAVTDASGAVCQIANLGLYSAAYTPECTQADATNPYALSSLLAPESGSPADITVLFPSQTGFGSLPAGLGVTEVPAFTSCEAFLGGTSGALGTNILSQLTTNAGTGGIPLALDSFQASVKEQFDQGVIDNLNELEFGLFTNIAFVMVNTTLEVLSLSLTISTDYTNGMGVGADWPSGVANAIGGSLPLLAETTIELVEAGRLLLPSEDNVYVLAVAGDQRSVKGIPTDGPWGFMSGPLCLNITGVDPCHAKQYLGGLAALFTALGPAGAETLNSVGLIIGALDLYLAGVNAAFMTSFTDDTLAATVQAGVNPTLNAAMTTAGVTAGIQSGYNTSAPLDSTTGFPDDPTAKMEDTNPSMVLVCAGADLPTDCTTLELLEATLNASLAAGDTDTAADVSSVLLIAGTCAATGWTACPASLTNNPAIVSPQYRAGVMFSVFGSLYSLSEATVLQGEDALIAEMVSTCGEHEQNLAAIQLLQTLAPVGTAFLGLGAIILIANLFLRNDKVKVIGIIGGVLCLIGTILVIAGLLVLQGTPIYSALGEEPADPLTDNTTSFALGGAYIIVLVFLGGAAVGSIVSIIGGALLSPKESSTDILGKA